MFDLDLDDELSLLVETASGFAADELTPRLRDAESARAVDTGARAAFAQIGLAGLELPEAAGGAGLASLARVLVNEELGAADAGAALALDPLGPALYPLLEAGGETALREHGLPLLEEEGARAVLVLEREARLEVDGDRVSGSVPWVPADRVDLLVVLRADEALLLREGIRATPLRGAGLRAAGASELRLEGARVAARLPGSDAAERARGRARLYAASLLLGVLRHAADFSRAYAQERVAFGRPIAHHQGLAFLITDMHMAVEGARWLVRDAAWRADAGHPFADVAAAAFAEVADAARLVGPNGVQILGGHGFMQDYPMEKAMREARALSLWLGGGDAAVDTAGRALCDGPHPVALSHGGVL
ncbi:MAG: acyl-CoA dehydrogenase family protein [Myxococcota bacterium]